MSLFGKNLIEDPSANQIKPVNPDEEKEKNDITTKEGAQNELFEKFRLRKTSDFQLALKDNIESVEMVINYIEEKKNEDQNNFPQYDSRWLKIRRDEIALFEKLRSTGDLEKIELRSKEEQEKELKNIFGFANTEGFLNILKSDIAKGKEFVAYITANKFRFTKYLATFDEWTAYCQEKIAEAEQAKQ